MLHQKQTALGPVYTARKNVSTFLVYFNQLAACTLSRRYAGEPNFCLEQTKHTLVRTWFYAQCRPGHVMNSVWSGVVEIYGYRGTGQYWLQLCRLKIRISCRCKFSTVRFFFLTAKF